MAECHKAVIRVILLSGYARVNRERVRRARRLLKLRGHGSSARGACLIQYICTYNSIGSDARCAR